MSSNVYGYRRSDANEIVSAMKNPNNFESILICTTVFIVIGLLMIVTGGVICLIYYTEITPPNFDSNYHRYVGSSMPRIVGPLLVAFGSLLSVGDIIIMGLAFHQHNSKTSRRSDGYERRAAIKTVPK